MPGNNGKDFLDWSKTPLIEPEHALSKSLGRDPGPILRKGEIPRRPSDEEVRAAIMHGVKQQPSDQQLFGHLVVTEEQVVKAEKEWNNQFNDFYENVKKPVEKQDLSKGWGSRGPIWKEELTEEEKRISEIAVDPSLLE